MLLRHAIWLCRGDGGWPFAVKFTKSHYTISKKSNWFESFIVSSIPPKIKNYKSALYVIEKLILNNGLFSFFIENIVLVGKSAKNIYFYEALLYEMNQMQFFVINVCGWTN